SAPGKRGNVPLNPMAGKSDNPPPLPQAVYERVMLVSAVEGRITMALASVFALMAAANRDVVGAVAGCIAAGAGAMEIHGGLRLRAFDLRGMDWLVRSQMLLLVTILSYLGLQLNNPTEVESMVQL